MVVLSSSVFCDNNIVVLLTEVILLYLCQWSCFVWGEADHFNSHVS